jgi:hypothetical protein
LFGVWAFGLLFFEGLMLGDIIHIIVVYGWVMRTNQQNTEEGRALHFYWGSGGLPLDSGYRISVNWYFLILYPFLFYALTHQPAHIHFCPETEKSGRDSDISMLFLAHHKKDTAGPVVIKILNMCWKFSILFKIKGVINMYL